MKSQNECWPCTKGNNRGGAKNCVEFPHKILWSTILTPAYKAPWLQPWEQTQIDRHTDAPSNLLSPCYAKAMLLININTIKKWPPYNNTLKVTPLQQYHQGDPLQQYHQGDPPTKIPSRWPPYNNTLKVTPYKNTIKVTPLQQYHQGDPPITQEYTLLTHSNLPTLSRL